MTQGNLVSPTLFNVIIYNIIQMWLDLMAEYQQVDLNGVGENVHLCLAVFYSNDGMVDYR